MGEPGMKVLAECASERERGALARFFYDHLQFNPSVDAVVAVSPLYPINMAHRKS